MLTSRTSAVRVVAPLVTALALIMAPQALATQASAPTAPATANAVQNTPAVTAGDVAITQSSGDSALLSSSRGATVDVARNPAKGVTLTSPAGRFNVGIPFAAQAAPGQTAGRDIAVYTGTGPAASTAVSATTDGARLSTVITDASAPTDYAYPITIPNGGSVALNQDGTASVLDSSGSELATVGAPIATDANGKSVPTHFETASGVLTQHVDHVGAAYPVVADPAISFSCHFPYTNCHADLSRKLTKAAGNYIKTHGGTVAGAAALAAAICTKIPNPFGAALCVGAIALGTGVFGDALVNAADRNRCLSIQYGLVPFPPFFLVHGVTSDGGRGCHNQ